MIEQVKQIIDHSLARRGIVPDYEQVLRLQVSATKGIRKFPAFNQHLFLLNASTLPVGMTITSDSNILLIEKHLQESETTPFGIVDVHEFTGDVLIEVLEDMWPLSWNAISGAERGARLIDRNFTWDLLFYHVIPKNLNF